jgi:3-hydroxyisobutyrate dehydrogenase-like beta-hydroxyacid dehydrogenase
VTAAQATDGAAKLRVGMVGIGMMGHGIASNLSRHGHALRLFEHPGNQPLDALKAAGATGYSSARALAADSEVVILVLTGSAQVEQVLCGADGVLEGLKPGSIVIDCSTSMPESTRRMAQQVQARGSQLLDAPMTRTPKEAAEGRLNLLVGGDAAVLDRCRPLLSCFAENIAHAGPTGAGHSLKLLHNFVSLGMVTLLAEAAACATRSGVAPAAFVDVLAQGGAAGVALERMRPFLLEGDPRGLRFVVDNARKDLSYYHAMAGDAGARRPIAAVLLQVMQDMVAAGHGLAMVPSLAQLMTDAPAPR